MAQVLDRKELEGTNDIAKYSFAVIEHLIIQIKKKAEDLSITTTIDSKTGKVITKDAEQ